MFWVKSIALSLFVLCLFVGGVVFDIFVIKKYAKDSSDDISVTQSISVSAMVAPSVYNASISIVGNDKLKALSELSDSQKAEIIKTFTDAISIANENNAICASSGYNLQLVDFYQDKSKHYSAHSSISCEFKSADRAKFSEAFKKINDIVKKSEFLVINISMQPPRVDSKDIDALNLEGEIIKKAQTQGETYAKSLNATCQIANMAFDNQHFAPISPLRNANLSMASSQSNIEVTPDSMFKDAPKSEEITKSASVSFKCKAKR